MTLHVDTKDSAVWKVEGELTFSSVPAIQSRSLDWFSSPPGAVDLAAVERIDSAGIALLIEWVHRARLAGVTLRLVNVPAGMSSLWRTTGLDRLLSIDRSSS